MEYDLEISCEFVHLILFVFISDTHDEYQTGDFKDVHCPMIDWKISRLVHM